MFSLMSVLPLRSHHASSARPRTLRTPVTAVRRDTPWDPSRAAEVQANLHLLDDFACHPDPKLAEFVKSEKSRLSQAIAEARKVRPPIYIDRDERSFE